MVLCDQARPACMTSLARVDEGAACRSGEGRAARLSQTWPSSIVVAHLASKPIR